VAKNSCLTNNAHQGKQKSDLACGVANRIKGVGGSAGRYADPQPIDIWTKIISNVQKFVL